ncbi:MAG: UDP-N-acetylmuramate dehydrogenase [Paenibacillaceae bacterium]|nr:UDP-N-acetylmuramate dehydrogenase [Paenibacillaceae bacterium]
MTHDEWVRTLRSIGDVRTDAALAAYTTWRIGGTADVLVVVPSIEALTTLCALAQAHGQQVTVLGRGSNVLVADEGVRGTVVLLGKAFSSIVQDDTRVHVGAGCSLIRLCVVVARWGLSGLEFAGGIPGSVGGAVVMNAGAHGGSMSSIVTHVEGITRGGTRTTWTTKELEFGYRASAMQQQDVVLTEVHLQLAHGDRKQIAQTMAHNKAYRMRTQPLHLACAGSVFRNPPGAYAAALIEQAGLKGTEIGGAVVSPLHANFFVNAGNATANDMRALMRTVRDRVYAVHGVWLEPEVRPIGGHADASWP